MPGSQLGDCEESNPVAGAVKAFRCFETGVTCDYQLLTPPDPPAVDIVRLPIVTAPMMIPTEQLLLDDYDAWTGFFSGSVVLPQSVWLATRLGSFDTIACNEPEPTELVHVDSENMNIVENVVGPSCITVLAADPRSPIAFIGASSGPAPMLYRFTGTGTVTQSVPVPLPIPFGPGDQVVSIALGANTQTIALALTTLAMPVEAWVIAFDLDTLAYRSTSPSTESQVRAGAFVGSTMYVTDRRRGRVLSHDVGRPRVVQSLGMTIPRGVSTAAGGAYFDPASEKFWSRRPATRARSGCSIRRAVIAR